MLRHFLAMSVILSILPAGARAQDPGVVVDPDSPSAKEYAIPLESARRRTADAQPRTGSSSGGQAAPLFGAGVGDDTAAGGGRGADPAPSRGTRARARPRNRPSRSAPASARDREVIEAAASRPGAPGGGSSAPIIGGAALLLLFAASAGLIARRRGSPA